MARRSRTATSRAWTQPPGSAARRPTATERFSQRRPIVPDHRFRPLPEPAGPPPYRRALSEVITPETTRRITHDGVLRFHCVGDTGGHIDPRPQNRVATAMARELSEPTPARFFYHLGDVVYPHGEESNYRSQFFSAYADYSAPIFGVPGNHDAESPDGLLTPFRRTFCSDAAPLHDAAARIPRPPARQPHVHWTLVHDWLWIIGLYSNVPEGGQFAADQIAWLIGELRAAPADAIVILALHQPVYAADVTHGSNLTLADALNEWFAAADRSPDAVFTGHAHNYQRFTRRCGGRKVPYVVAGAGGYHELHPMAEGLPDIPASFPAAGTDDVTLEAYEDEAHGFMTVTITPQGGQVTYTAVSDGTPTVVDAFRLGGGVT